MDEDRRSENLHISIKVRLGAIPEGGVKSILDLDANSLCRSLVELQEVLDHHGVSDAAECIEKRKESINVSKLQS